MENSNNLCYIYNDIPTDGGAKSAHRSDAPYWIVGTLRLQDALHEALHENIRRPVVKGVS